MELTPDVTSENRHLIVVLIEDSQLEPAIAREIARYHRNRLGTRIQERDRDGSGKPPATVSQEDRDIAGTLIGDGQIEHAVIGEVARHDRLRDTSRLDKISGPGMCRRRCRGESRRLDRRR